MNFKDTIMGKMTKGAIINWGENDENNKWFQPTEEQAEAMISEGGLQLGSKTIDYSSSDKATNGKTYGSETAAIKGLVELIAEVEGLSEEQKKELAEQIKLESYTQSSLSPEVSARINSAMESKGIEAAIIKVLGTIHDNWVKDNANKFDAPDRANRLYQFVDLRLMSFGKDGAVADLLFLQPILEGAGITVDLEKLQEEFQKQQKEYMEEHSITDSESLKTYLMNIAKEYPTIEGLTTTKGQKDNIEKLIIVPRYLISAELLKTEILERMTEQVSAKLGIEYQKEQDNSVENSKEKLEGSNTIDKEVNTSFLGFNEKEDKIEEIDRIINSKAIIEAQEAYDLKPAETRKGGFINYVKSLVEKIKGLFGR